MPAQTPTLLVYFNRPEILRRNLAGLAGIAPRVLFVAADGPRAGNLEDQANTERCHQLIAELVKWPCEIKVLRSTVNYGVDVWLPKAIDWFFSEVDEGIILEDDCLVSTSFFKFAAQLLAEYRDVPHVMNISAPNFQRRKWGDGDFYFSSYPSNWGWATWRRAWKAFDASMDGLDEFVVRGLPKIIPANDERRYWVRFFRGLRSGRYSYWDAKWVYSIWKAGGVSITPNVNLVTNVGFGSDATHTRRRDVAMGMQVGELAFPLRRPSNELEISRGADRHLYETRYRPRILARVEAVLNRLMRHH